ncbi:hypothetical protein KY335_04480 [Candidatus Woesearchaeota archaeon]|nr:hypothetical protein [Candidatus Woesearchaeota archaeon]
MEKMKVIVTAKENIASMNMFKIFVEELGFAKTDRIVDGNPCYEKGDFLLVTSNGGVIPIEHINDFFKDPPEIYIIASSHKSEGGVKLISCHTPGNWLDAGLGGNPEEVAVAPALYLRNMLKELMKYSGEEYQKSYEVTHHGPSSMNAPIMFVEVGASETEWNDMDAVRFVCKCILTANNDNKNSEGKEVPVAVGFGGPHYAPVFSREEYVDNVAVGHIMPKYAVADVKEEVVLQAFENTEPKATLAVMEWKGLSGEDKTKLKELFEKNKIPWKKLKDFKEL